MVRHHHRRYPTNSNIVFFGGQESDPNTGALQVLETTDSGATFTDISVGASGVDGPHTDHHAMTFDSNGNLLDGNDGGVWRLQNATPGAIAWQDINGNLSTLQAEGIGLIHGPEHRLPWYAGQRH